MFNSFKNLLPKIIFERIVLNQEFSKISLRFPGRFTRLTILALLVLTLTGYYPAFSFPPLKRSVADAAEIVQEAVIVPASFPTEVILPHPGYLSTKFSNYHPGVDIAAGLGMPIHPINPGIVRERGFDIFGLGNFVVIAHEGGFKSKYGHLGKIYVKKDDKVDTQSIIGEVGLTGYTSGPHTHLEITHYDKFINPLDILPQIPPMTKK